MWYEWLAVIIILAFVEFLTVGLTTIWFVISGIVALLASFVIDDFAIQFAIFVILGIILLLTTRKKLEEKLVGKKEKTNLDRIIGMKGIVTDDIYKNHTGEVKVDGKRWTAYADDDILKDETVKILEINGVKLKVEKE